MSGDTRPPDPLPDEPAQARRALVAALSPASVEWTGPLGTVLERLLAAGRADLALGRLVEGHADACRILDQAGRAPADGTYGVWASRSAGTGLTAVPTDDGWHLSGELRFASGVDLIDHALVVGQLPDGHHRLFVMPAREVTVVPGSWSTAAMTATRSFTVTVDARLGPDAAVGPPDFYLDRPGFVVGGLGPAAVWAGGARRVLDLVVTASAPFDLTAHQRRRIGVMAQAVWTARTVLGGVATEVDPLPRASSPALDALVGRARTAVVQACDTVLGEAPMVVGPGGLTRVPDLDRAIRDLALYVRQHHVDLTLERLGGRVLGQDEA